MRSVAEQKFHRPTHLLHLVDAVADLATPADRDPVEARHGDVVDLEAEHAAGLLHLTAVQRAIANHGPRLIANGDLEARLDIVIAAGSLAAATVREEVLPSVPDRRNVPVITCRSWVVVVGVAS
jgi:hypothetical protein